MARKLRSDRLLFVATFLLVCASVVMVFSASAVYAKVRFQQEYLFLFKQATWAALGFVMLGIVMRIDYRYYRQPFVIWTLVGVVLAALVAVLFGPPINGTRRWFAVAGVGIQPSELAKIAAVFFRAALLERRMERINDVGYGLRPIGLMLARHRRAGPPGARPRDRALALVDRGRHGLRGRAVVQRVIRRFVRRFVRRFARRFVQRLVTGRDASRDRRRQKLRGPLGG